MMEPLSWEMLSSEGGEVARWTVATRTGRGYTDILYCNVQLEGQWWIDIDEGKVGRCSLEVGELGIPCDELRRLVAELTTWLRLPLASLRDSPLDVTCGMGGRRCPHPNWPSHFLTLSIRSGRDSKAAEKPVAGLQYTLGSLTGELTLAVDPSCLQLFVDGIARALEESGEKGRS